MRTPSLKSPPAPSAARAAPRTLLSGVVLATALAVAGAAAFDPAPALAQLSPPAKSPPAPGATKGPAPQPKAAAPKAEGGGDGNLRQRVEQLEEQLVDLQVVIGTLESLAKTPGGGGGGVAPSFRGGGGGGVSAAEAGRLDGLETQIRALTAQVEQLSDRLRQGGAAPPAAGGSFPLPRAEVAPPPRAPAGFGSTTISTGAGQGSDADSQALGRMASAPPPADGVSPKQLYEQAYGFLLQQDYASAESSFDDFLRRFPNDNLAGNAQYWLGESHFVRGQYKAAAGAFLKGYQTYARSVKAPDSLLKLAMSLDRLGQRDAACSSYGELGTRFPNAPAHVKTRAESERRRVGCQ